MPGHERERLTDSEYEDCYSEAFLILGCKYDCIGVPYRKDSGERICPIETLQADDMTVFLLAFRLRCGAADRKRQTGAYSFTLRHDVNLNAWSGCRLAPSGPHRCG